MPLEWAGANRTIIRMGSATTESTIAAESVRPRIATLDLLRAIACLWVVLSHSPLPPDCNPILRRIASSRGGVVGVDIFFVLSGFLVSGLLFQEYQRRGRVNAGRFLIRRAFKIYPSFYFFLFCTVVAIHLFANDPSKASIQRVAAEALFVQNYFPGVWGHTWSLAVEEHFYLLVAISIWLMSRRGGSNPFRSWPILVLILSFACLTFRLSIASEPSSFRTHVFPTHLRLDGLAFGSLLSYFQVFGGNTWITRIRSLRVPVFIGGCLLLSGPFFIEEKLDTVRRAIMFTTDYLGAGAILASSLTFRRPLPISLAGLIALGRQSYCIYLWQAVVLNWIVPRIESRLSEINPYLPCVAAILLSTALGWIMGSLIERPFLALREKLAPRSR